MKDKTPIRAITHNLHKNIPSRLYHTGTFLTIVLLCTGFLPCLAGNGYGEMACAEDSVGTVATTEVYRNYKFSGKKLIAPGIMIAAGAAAIPFHDKLGEWGKAGNFKMDDYIQYVPAAAYLLTGFTRIEHRHNVWQRVQIAATAYIIETCLVNAIKYTAREQRPDNGSYNSFPSGHTASAMVGAELCRLEYGWKIGLCAYSVALVTAGLRVYNHRHWCNDVLAGAGIGILSANAAYWLYPLEQRLFSRRNKNESNSASFFVMPIYEPTSSTASLAFQVTL